RKGRLHILNEMSKVMTEARGELSQWAPRIITIQVNPEKIGEIIGPKGKTIRAIQEETGAQISIDDSGLVTIASVSGEGGERAKARSKGMTQDPEVGLIYEGPVKSTTAFGAFVEILPGTEGLLHISEMQEGRTERTEDVVKKGDIVRVKLLSIDEKGKMRLSRKAAMAEEGGSTEAGAEGATDTGARSCRAVSQYSPNRCRAFALRRLVYGYVPGPYRSRPRRWVSVISSSTWYSRARPDAARRNWRWCSSASAAHSTRTRRVSTRASRHACSTATST